MANEAGLEGPCLRVMMYAQHLSGVGHFVRSQEIARAMAEKHEVVLTDGGRMVPRPWPARVGRLMLPRIHRSASGVASLHRSGSNPACMEARRRLLGKAAESLRPDVLMIEHYPFSKWELGEEISHLVDAARRSNPRLKVVCSVRDIPRQTSHEACGPDEYAKAVLTRLHEQFDALLVHGDASMTPLSDSFPGTAAIRIPIHYTGWVSEKLILSPGFGKEIEQTTNGRPFVLASAGGGADGAELLTRCMDAWISLKNQHELKDFALVAFSGLAGITGELQDQAGLDSSIHLLPFSPGFLGWMQHARLSISCAGYNTCTNILETHCRAILMPNLHMSDQRARATLLERLGQAEVVPDTGHHAENLSAAILRALHQPKPSHRLATEGALRTVDLLERLVSSTAAHARNQASY